MAVYTKQTVSPMILNCDSFFAFDPHGHPHVYSKNKICKGTLMGTPNREPQEYSRNLIEYKDPGKYIPIIFLLYSWGSLFGVPIRVPLILLVSSDHGLRKLQPHLVVCRDKGVERVGSSCFRF